MKKGIEFYKANGKDKALAAFNDPKGQFVKDDLYIFVLDLNGKMLAHTKADLVGKDFMREPAFGPRNSTQGQILDKLG